MMARGEDVIGGPETTELLKRETVDEGKDESPGAAEEVSVDELVQNDDEGCQVEDARDSSGDETEGPGETGSEPALELVLDLCAGMGLDAGPIPPEHLCTRKPLPPDYSGGYSPARKLNEAWFSDEFSFFPVAYVKGLRPFCWPDFGYQLAIFLDNREISRISQRWEAGCTTVDPGGEYNPNDTPSDPETRSWLDVLHTLVYPYYFFGPDDLEYGEHHVVMTVVIPELGLYGEASAKFFVSRCSRQCVAWGDWQTSEVTLMDGGHNYWPAGLTAYPDESGGIAIVATGFDDTWKPGEPRTGWTALVRGSEDQWISYVTWNPAEATSFDPPTSVGCPYAILFSTRQKYWYSPQSGNVFLVLDSLQGAAPGQPAIRIAVWNPISGDPWVVKDLVINSEHFGPEITCLRTDYVAMVVEPNRGLPSVIGIIHGGISPEMCDIAPLTVIWRLDGNGEVIETKEFGLEDWLGTVFYDCEQAYFEFGNDGILHGILRGSLYGTWPSYISNVDGTLKWRAGVEMKPAEYVSSMLQVNDNTAVIYV